MERNQKLYQASWYLVHAARLLTDIDDNLKKNLLEKALDLSNKIVINEEENQKILEYKELIKEEGLK